MRGKALSATNCSVHHYLECDLYLHNVYHGSPTVAGAVNQPSELSKAQFERGNDWESSLFSWLDENHLLLTVHSRPLDASDLQEIIELDDRDHFYIAGLSFWPPKDKLNAEFSRAGTNPVKFGLFKPDLLEITRSPDRSITWRVIDAKASLDVKTPHHVQIFFYALCLEFLLPNPYFYSSQTVAIWLPPLGGFQTSEPSFDDLKSINLVLLSGSLKTFFFRKLPEIMELPRPNVRWHYNPLCRNCPYNAECRTRALREGKLGSMPNISLDQVTVLENLLQASRSLSDNGPSAKLNDIEDLHNVIANQPKLNALESSFPGTTRKAKRILRIPLRSKRSVAVASAVVEASRMHTLRVINKRNFTCPRSEDIAAVLSLVQDPVSSRIVRFCLSSFSTVPSFLSSQICGGQEDLVSVLSSAIKSILDLTSPYQTAFRTQFYVFSTNERNALQRHLIDTALAADHEDVESQTAIRLCIGALCDGASLLSTSFQPLILSGALLDFLGRKGYRSRAELKMCLERLQLSTEGNVEELRIRIQKEVQRLKEEGGRHAMAHDGSHGTERRMELGQLPRIVIVKSEVERLLALPVPGYWDLPECVSTLTRIPNCPSDEDIYARYRNGTAAEVENLLEERNWCIFDVLQCLRAQVSTSAAELLVNDARILSAHFMDICQQPALRKLFFMQQFEVLSRLTELWRSRIDGCPDAPILEYRSTAPFKPHTTPERIFFVTSGALDVSPDKDRAFYDYLLVEDSDDMNEIPVEALFDDLGVSGLVFPLNKFTRSRWNAQHLAVQRGLLIADLQDIAIDGRLTKVTLRTWGSLDVRLVPGRRYRLSRRLVDFNITKTLSTLVELDFRCGPNKEEAAKNVPFLQLISDPRSFVTNGQERSDISRDFLKTEAAIQHLFRELHSLDNQQAGALLLKASQRRATQRIIASRLSVIWGPPGTGKTYTIALSLLRLFDIQHRLGVHTCRIVFLTAMTHAAIQACLSKLSHLKDCYRNIKALPARWLDHVNIEHVVKGGEHPAPNGQPHTTYIYAGTVYQLYNFSKRHSFEVDCVVIDEAGQLALSSTALVLRSLSPNGRIVVAGDSEQLAPILTAQYPQLDTRLFGSILDCLIHLSRRLRNDDADGIPRPPSPTSTEASDISASQVSTVVQLTENFRLNPDLGEFVSTIYSRAFIPQKSQARQVAARFKSLTDVVEPEDDITRNVRDFLLALSDVMLRRRQTLLQAPHLGGSQGKVVKTSDSTLTPHPISLALIRLHTLTRHPEQAGYETHVRGEAAVAAALVSLIRQCSPDDDIFVATPHRIQRQAVKEALGIRKRGSEEDLVDALKGLNLGSNIAPTMEKVRVDTVERLQGSEAAFVICLFSLPSASSSTTADLGFLLERRRLNVAISRAKTLCLLLTSDEVLRPSVRVLASQGSSAGYAFLRAYEERAWSATITVDLDLF